MANKIAVLDKEKHKKIKIKTNENFATAANENLASVTIKEIGMMGLNYPLFIIKGEANNIRCIAMLGFKQGENLFYAEDKWKSNHVPLIIQSQPFTFGKDESDPEGNKVVTCLVEDSHLVDEKEGNALYLDDGTPSNFLKRQEEIMAELFDGEVLTAQFLAKLMELDLLEECSVILGFEDGKTNAITGLNMISLKKLQALDDATYIELKNLGYLPAMYLISNSVGNIHTMSKYHNEKSDDKIVQFQISLESDPKVKSK